MPYNEAPVVNGSDPNQARVELLRGWLSSYRPDLTVGAGVGTNLIVEETLD
jgi:hypothetical protein